MLKQLAPPQNWDDFEHMCRDLWAKLLGDTETKMHGRRGQSQNGVDVYGYSVSKELIGIQCKGKDNFLGNQITNAELKLEATKALKFKPSINKFILATTAVTDKKVQEFTRVLDKQFSAKNNVSISLWSWPEISEALQNYPELLQKYYPEIFIAPNLTRLDGCIEFKCSLGPDYEKRVASLFEIEDFKELLDKSFILEVRNFITEIASNAYRHGRAKLFRIRIERSKIEVIDNGKKFDLPHELTIYQSDNVTQGLKYISYFLQKHKTNVESLYEYDDKLKNNILTMKFNQPIAEIKINSCLISFRHFGFLGREEAALEGSRLELPEGCTTYTLHLDSDCFMWSSIYQYINAIVEQIPPGKKVRIFINNESFKSWIESTFNSEVIEVC